MNSRPTIPTTSGRGRSPARESDSAFDSPHMPETPLWTPSSERIAATRLAAFLRLVETSSGRHCSGFADLHRFSVEEPESFWSLVWDSLRGSRDARGRSGPRSRPHARRRVLPGRAAELRGEPARRRRRTARHRLPGRGPRRAAADARRTATPKCRRVSAGARRPGRGCWRPRGGLRAEPARGRSIAVLAAASLGAIWSSCSPDFGVQGVLDRFGQIAPKVLVAADGYFYSGRAHDSLERAGGDSRADCRRWSTRSSCRTCATRPTSARSVAASSGRQPRAALTCRSRRPLRGLAVQPPALHPLLVRHDRRAQVHRARRRRARCSST